MPHIEGAPDLETCVVELFDSDETMHAKISTMSAEQAHKAEAFENELQAWTTETLKKVEGFQARVDELNA